MVPESSENPFLIQDIEEEEIEYYEQLGIHQKLKHKFIEIYLGIWVENVGLKSKKNPPTVDFFDLYAASGLAHDKYIKSSWHGSALLAAKAFGEYPKGNLLFLNSYDEDPEKCEKQLEILKRSIRDLEDCPHVFEKTIFISEEIHRATKIALRNLNKDFPSLWILDPCHPDQLPWEIVENIGSTVGKQYKEGVPAKKPELIINLMTSIIQRNINKKPEIFSNAIGLSEDEWRPLYEKYEKKWREQGIEKCTRRVILDVYAERLSNLYNKRPLIALVNAAKGGVVYTMLLVTDSDAGYYTMMKKMKEWEEYKIYRWKPEATLSSFKRDNPTQQGLEKWLN
ncbi:MAG: three-Cys-motif partner protein TcmP [Methanolinea sp.]|jgi:three-Cys-motif partner protein